MNHTDQTDDTIPAIPESVLKNVSRTQRIINAYEQLVTERGEDEFIREPSREEVGALAGASMRDVPPVLKIHRELKPLQARFDQLPEVLTLQVLATLDQHFCDTSQAYETQREQLNSVFDEEVSAFSEAMATLERQVDDLQTTVLEKEGIITHLTEDTATLREEVAQWQGKHRGVTEQYQKTATELREVNEALARSLTTIDTLKAEYQTALSSAEASHQAQRAELVQQHEKANDVLMTELGNERGERKTERKGFERQQADSRVQLETLQQAHADRNVLLAQSNSEVSRLTLGLASLQQLHDVSLADIKDLQPLPEALRQLEIDNTRLTGENSKLQQQTSQQTKAQEQLTQQLEVITKTMASMQQQLTKP